MLTVFNFQDTLPIMMATKPKSPTLKDGQLKNQFLLFIMWPHRQRYYQQRSPFTTTTKTYRHQRFVSVVVITKNRSYLQAIIRNHNTVSTNSQHPSLRTTVRNIRWPQQHRFHLIKTMYNWPMSKSAPTTRLHTISHNIIIPVMLQRLQHPSDTAAFTDKLPNW